MAQKELHASLDYLDKAIKLLPGASRFLDRQAMVTRGIGSNDTFQQSMDLQVSAPTAKGKRIIHCMGRDGIDIIHQGAK